MSGISVIIPTLDEEKVIESGVRQFGPYREQIPLEVIVSDDGSADSTAKIAGQCADRVLLNRSEARGRSGALNRGAAAARYSTLLFLDADIRIDPMEAFFREVEETFERDAGAVGGMIDYRVYPELETAADRFTHHFWNRVMQAVHCTTGIGICTPGFQLTKKRFFDQVGGYDEEMRLIQDVEYMIRLSRVGRIHYFRRALVLESPRRYRDEGYLVYSWRSLLRWGHLLFRRRSYGHYKCVR